MAVPQAPSAPPTSVRVSEVTSSSITIQWGPVDCIHRNGDITGYSVQYGEVGSVKNLQVVANRQATITGLDPFTEYIVSVAVITSVDTGVYSAEFVNQTTGEHIYNVIDALHNKHFVDGVVQVS